MDFLLLEQSLKGPEGTELKGRHGSVPGEQNLKGRLVANPYLCLRPAADITDTDALCGSVGERQ